MIRNAKRGDRVLVPDRNATYMASEKNNPLAEWTFSKGRTGTVVNVLRIHQKVYVDVEADPPNYGVITFKAGELQRIAQNPPPHSCYLCGKELINLNYQPYCLHCQIYSLPACPVCRKGYIRTKADPINGDHYWHFREMLFENIPHYPPSALCVDREDKS